MFCRRERRYIVVSITQLIKTRLSLVEPNKES
jgi:hypothetical protein